MDKIKFIRRILYALGFVLTFFPILYSFINGYIFCDSAYYLSIVERIAEGYVPYKTLKLGYTPLWFYIAMVYKWLFNIPIGLYEPYLFLHYIFQMGCAFFVYKILVNFKFRKELSIFTAFLFILITHWLYGNTVLLEMPSMFFGLMSCSLVLKYKESQSVLHYLWIGGICACSFLCKQFGLGFLPLALYLIIFFHKDNKIKKSIYLLIGYSILIIICFIIWEKDFIPLIFSSYGTTSAESAGYDVSMNAKMIQIINNILFHLKRINPAILFSFCLLPIIIKQNRMKEYLFCLCGFLGFMLQFYFVVGGYHYQLYTIPFSIFIIAILLSLEYSRLGKVCIIILAGIILGISLYSTYYNRVYKWYFKSDYKSQQIEIGNWLVENTTNDKRLFIVNSELIYNYYISNMLPPNLSTIGYTFGPLGLSEDKCRMQIDSADYILRYTKMDSFDIFFTAEMESLCNEMPSIYYNDEIVLHVNKK